MVALAGLAATIVAQPPRVDSHPYASVNTAGAIGSRQLTRGGPVSGYLQPVEIRAPHGAGISLAGGGDFDGAVEGERLVGLQVAPVYRLKVTNIKNAENREVYPTIELVDRTYPPLGQETKYPIPIHIDQEDLELALEGKFVTRVIYIESPQSALAIATTRKDQSWYDVATHENPLEVADRLGRPVAILRLGGRLPGPMGPDHEFMYGCPTWMPLDPPPMVEEQQVAPGSPQQAKLRAVPRTTKAPAVKPAPAAASRQTQVQRAVLTTPSAATTVAPATVAPTAATEPPRKNPLRR